VRQNPKSRQSAPATGFPARSFTATRSSRGGLTTIWHGCQQAERRVVINAQVSFRPVSPIVCHEAEVSCRRAESTKATNEKRPCESKAFWKATPRSVQVARGRSARDCRSSSTTVPSMVSSPAASTPAISHWQPRPAECPREHSSRLGSDLILTILKRSDKMSSTGCG